MEKLRKISTMYYVRQIVACLLIYCILLAVPMQVALANPDPLFSAHPSTGSGGYTATLGGSAGTIGTLTNIIAPNGSIFNWQNFDIGKDHEVSHIQGVTDAVLHRVNATDLMATGIMGKLNAPGYLFVVNPRGIVIGADALIEANRFVASGLNISDTDFLGFLSGTTNDELRFDGYEVGTLGVELKEGGVINASTVALIGKTVLNAGIIMSDTVVLAAGERVYLAITEGTGGKIYVEVADLVTSVPADNTVNNTDTATFTTTDGDVLLAAGDIYSAAITGVGSLAAVANGSILLNGDLEAGEITLTADYDGVNGGDVTATGTLTSTTGDIEISASDNTIYLLGDYINAAGSVLLKKILDKRPTTEAYGNIIAGQDVTLNGTVELKGFGDQTDQFITATTGKIQAIDWIHKTSPGNLDIFGGSIGDLATSVYVEEVRVEDGELNIHGNVRVQLNGGIYSSGNMRLSSNEDGVGSGYLLHDSSGTIESLNGDIDMSAGGSQIYLSGGPDMPDNYVSAGEDILLNDDVSITANRKLHAGQDVILADGETMTGAGILTVEADRDIVLGGAVTAGGTMTLKADADTVDNEPGYTVGGLMWAKSTLETTAGDIDIYAADTTILLDDDVTADENLILNDNTNAAADITLKAGNNVESKAHLTALGSLTIEAGDLSTTPGGAITAHEIIMNADGTTLTLRQNDKLDMEQNVTVTNRNNTHLDATSTADSVTSIAAAKWLDITAWADENITLSDESGDITTLQLSAANGDIKITANDGKLFAQGTIGAGRDVVITATDEGSAAILLDKNVDAGRDILLKNNTWAANGVEIDAGRDVTVGDGTADGTTLTGAGDLWVEAARHITLGGDVTAYGNLKLLADYDIDTKPGAFHDGEGNMTAHGSIETTRDERHLFVRGKNIQIDGHVNIAGNIDMYGGDDITLGDYVIAKGDIGLHANYVSGSGAPWDYDDGVGDVHAMSYIETTKGVIFNGNLYVEGENIQVDGTINTDGYIYMTADDSITLGDTVEADDDIDLYADEDNDPLKTGLMWAKSSITTTSGGYLDVEGENIQVDGPINTDGWILMRADDSITLASNVEAGGNIDLYSSDDTTYLGGSLVKAAGDLTLHNNTELNGTDDPDTPDDEGDQRIEATTGTLWAKNTLTKIASSDGDLTLSGATTINLDGTVSVETTTGGGLPDAGGNGSLIIENSFTAAADLLAQGSVYFTDATQTNVVNARLDGGHLGPPEVRVDQRIRAENGAVYSNGSILKPTTAPGNLTIFGDYEYNGSNPWGYSVQTKEVRVEDGELTIKGNGYVYLVGDIYSSGNMWLSANQDQAGYSGYLQHGGSGYTIESLNGDIDISATNYNIYLSSGPDMPDNYVSAGGDILLHNDTYITGNRKLDAGQDVIIGNGTGDGTTLTGQGALTVEADRHITLGGAVVASDVTSGDLILEADAGDLGGNMTAYGTITNTANGGGSIDIYSSDGTTELHDNVTAGVDITLHNNTWAADGVLLKADDDVRAWGTVTGAGDLTIEAGVIESGSAGDYANVLLDKWVTVDGDLAITAGDDITANGKLTSNDVVSSGDMTLNAGDDIYLNAVLESAESAGLMQIQADLDPLNGTGNVDVAGSLEGNMKLSGTNFYVDGTIYSHGTLDVDADDDIELRANVSSVGVMTMDAGGNIELNRSSGNTSSDSTITLNAGDDITIGRPMSGEGNVTANGHMGISAGTDSDDDVKVFGKLTTTNGGNINVQAGGDIKLYGTFDGPVFESAQADGDLTLDAEDDVDVLGNLISNSGDIEIYSSDVGSGGDTIYLGGDKVQAFGNILLNNNTEFDGDDDQKVDAQTGMITANGWLYKGDSSLYLEAAGDVSLFDRVTADSGGVSIISENGMIFSPDDFYDPTDTLNVSISGYSDQGTGAGVDLPYGPGKAAIVVMSKADLKLGEDAVLTASGMYDNSGAVDDRAAMGLLDDGDPATATIGGVPRDEGDPFDAAIYLASTGGDVDVSGPVTIESYNMILDGPITNNNDESPGPRYEYVPQGAMVIDAFDSVTFGAAFEGSLANGDVGDRLEVVSRITEWLFQAVGRLPYPYGGGPFPLDYTYVLRGAGLDNPVITDGRAWVLEDPFPAAPLAEEAGQALVPLTLGLAGCPVLVAAVSAELGVPGDTIEVSLANSFALNTNIQPCESCARLLSAATILRDEDGSGMAALNQVFNTVAPAGAPFTPGMAASIATAFAGRVGDGTQYATAIEYIDAFVRYLAVLDTEMGSPVADGDSIAFVMGKYGTGITGSDNSNIAAFVATRLESSATFGE